MIMTTRRRVWMVAGSLVAAAGLCFAFWPRSPEDALLRFLEQEYPKAKEVVIYSLDPDAAPEHVGAEAPKTEQFWGCSVLGKVALVDADDRGEAKVGMIDAVKSGTQDYSMACFDPRHAFRITTQNETVVTIALCYDCGAVKFTGIRSLGLGCQIGSGGWERLTNLQAKHKLPRDIPDNQASNF
jgi:hypothetical protein